MNKKILPLAAAAVFGCASAQASVGLIAVGKIPGTVADLSKVTAAPLENGIAGNLLGGMGSGLAYAGCNTFLAVPDRGPNATPYNSTLDDTASFVARIQTLKMNLAPVASGSLSFTLTPSLVGTTLLWTRDALVYGTGSNNGVSGNQLNGSPMPSGAPAINTSLKHYFTGRSDNFDPAQNSENVLNGRFDPESIRVSPDGLSVYISDEYGPYIYKFNRLTGERIATYTLPPATFAVTTLKAQGSVEISSNTSGRVTNKGMEGLALSPDGSVLFGAMQSTLLQEGADSGGGYIRIVRIVVATGATTQYAYQISSSPKTTVSDIVAINDHELLVDERDSKGQGDNSTAAFKKLYRINLAAGNYGSNSPANDISALSGQTALAPNAVTKTLFLDVFAGLTGAPYSLNAKNIPAKLEGVAFGPDVTVGGAVKHTVFVANDNDFLATATVGTTTVDNPNQFFVFAFDPADLPSYVPQQVNPALCR